ncbi:hypothetical protein [Neisseria dentiae]|uniref:hypothetical protein n=1 Tax=Neisseria dentiae TaxID=194197 RepID=UPI00359F2D6E
MKKALFPFILMSCAIFSFAKEPSSSKEWPAGAIRNGTLGNPTLVHDAMLAARGQATVMGCDQVKDGHFFVKKDVSGKPGERVWEEIWQFQCTNGNYNVEMEFMESKQGGVTFRAAPEGK